MRFPRSLLILVVFVGTVACTRGEATEGTGVRTLSEPLPVLQVLSLQHRQRLRQRSDPRSLGRFSAGARDRTEKHDQDQQGTWEAHRYTLPNGTVNAADASRP